MQRKTTLERAFELARSGSCFSVADVRAKLKSENYDLQQLSGSSLSRQLRELIRASTPAVKVAPIASGFEGSSAAAD